MKVPTRELSLEFLTSLCESSPSVVRERGADMVQALVPLAIHMLAGQQGESLLLATISTEILLWSFMIRVYYFNILQ